MPFWVKREWPVNKEIEIHTWEDAEKFRWCHYALKLQVNVSVFAGQMQGMISYSGANALMSNFCFLEPRGSSSSTHKSLNEQKPLHSEWVHLFHNSFVQDSVVLSSTLPMTNCSICQLILCGFHRDTTRKQVSYFYID